MKGITEPIEERANYAANQTAAINLRLDGYITQIMLKLQLVIRASTAAVPNVTDPLHRIINGLRVLASNAVNFFSVTDGRQLHWLTQFKYEGTPFVGALPAAGLESTVRAQYVIHPGSRTRDQFDITRVIPLRGLSNTQIQVDWNPATAIGVGYTISSGFIKATVSRTILEKGEVEDQAFGGAQGAYMLQPRTIPIKTKIDGIFGSYGFKINLPTGAYIRNVLLMVVDSTDERTSTDIDQLQIENNKGWVPFKRDWLDFEWESAGFYHIAPPVSGVVVVGFGDISQVKTGIDMVSAGMGDWKLGFTTTAQNGYVHQVWEAADLVACDPTVVGT